MIDAIPLHASSSVSAGERRPLAFRHEGGRVAPPEAGLADIVELVALTLGVSAAVLGVIEGGRLRIEAATGLPPDAIAQAEALWAAVAAAPDLLVVPDLADGGLVGAACDAGFAAGLALRDRFGDVAGLLCILDVSPRPDGLTAREIALLHGLARQAATLLGLRRSISGRDDFIAVRRSAERRMGEEQARLRISEAHWRGLFERVEQGFVIGELVRDASGEVTDWRHLDANAAWGGLLGVVPADALGRTIREVLPGIGEGWVHDLAHAVESGEAAMLTRRIGGSRRWFEGRAFPLDGDRFAALLVDATGRFQAEIHRNALLEIGDQLRDLTEIGAMTRVAATIVGEALVATRVNYGRISADGLRVEVEPGWVAEGMTDTAGTHLFADYGDISGELLSGDVLVIEDVLADPRSSAQSARWRGLDIRALVNIPIEERGRPVALLIVHDDKPRIWSPETITFLRNVADRLMAAVARVRAEQQQAVLNQELSHRMKNMLAMIQAIAMQTLRQVSERDAVLGFHKRLHALSSAHDVLLRQNWTAAPIETVVEAVVNASSQRERFEISGPDVTLGPRATLSLSLLLHELATNAAKYGALSTDTGRVIIAWRIEAATDELMFGWTETGGPAAQPPARKGFGSRLIHAGLLGTGGVTLRYLDSGFECEMHASRTEIESL